MIWEMRDPVCGTGGVAVEGGQAGDREVRAFPGRSDVEADQGGYEGSIKRKRS